MKNLSVKYLGHTLTLALVAAPAQAQQTGDPSFHFDNRRPAYAEGEGPSVCIDEAHNNFHTAAGRYKPFADLLRGDGYVVVRFKSAFSRATLADCAVLVSANPDAREETPWAFPHPPAFSREEITELIAWIRGGGALALFIDHQPVPGVAGDLGAVLGVAMLDGVAVPDPGSSGLPDVFSLADGTLEAHAIAEGRDPTERVESVATFTGHAFYPSRDVQALLVLGSDAVSYVDLEEHDPEIPSSEWPRFDVAGWLQGATRVWGQGRVVILGEAAITAQLAGKNKRPIGMNHPEATHNAQFCLNVVHWLDGLLE